MTTRLAARVDFPLPPSLSELIGLLRVVGEESPEYETFSVSFLSPSHCVAQHRQVLTSLCFSQENCWFFASIVQELFTEVYGGMLNGVLHHADRSAATRLRIRARLRTVLNDGVGPSSTE